MNSTEELKFKHSRVNGIVFQPFFTKERLHEIKNYPTRNGDVFIVSYPKSGTMWVTQIVKQIAKPSMPVGIEEKDIIGGTVAFWEFNTPDKLEALPSPRYMYTHLPYTMLPHNSEQNLKYIVVARNPRDVAVSYFNFMRVVNHFEWDGHWDEFFDYFMQGNVPFGSYFDRVLEWWEHRNEPNVLFLKYEDLKKDTEGQIQRIAQFLGYNLSAEEINNIREKTTFSAMKSDPTTNMDQYADKIYKKETQFSFMRKGIVGDWQNYFSEKQLEELNKLYDLKMSKSGLEFEFT